LFVVPGWLRLRSRRTFPLFLKLEMLKMKRFISTALCLSFFSIGVVGCAEKTSTKTELKITTPTGTKTVTQETEVKETGTAKPTKAP